ncbi:DEAD/DEAH box helicase family protein [Helicobacter baculiformis]|uniref:DEAD/DEAH box helicase family protein n=1 Tax=Helicobacter baculiformis TaxID=427351 RepID=A0ABV7ZIL7_9HELI|nr:DEAD/DEAH box helicase family protein [Helicobacter baculiformis]
MPIQITPLQDQKVHEIVAHYARMRAQEDTTQATTQSETPNNPGKIVEFKAPTGAGKTLMASLFISRLIAHYPETNFIFIIATLSSAELPGAFVRKIRDYSHQGVLDTPILEVAHYESPSASKAQKCESVPPIRCQKNKVYLFGKSTFGKGKLYTELKIIDAFVLEAARDYSLIYIRDEAHIGTKATEKPTFEKLLEENAAFILRMTATFDQKTLYPRVEITQSELEKSGAQTGQYLLKNQAKILENEAFEDSKLIDQAIERFKEIKEAYQKLEQEGVFIRPAMLIQVDNQPDAKKQPDAFTKWQNTLQELKAKFEAQGLSWVQYFGESSKESLKTGRLKNTPNGVKHNRRDNDIPKDALLHKISQINDTTDCIVFKIGPATGWDIPRACMLLRLRNVCSSALSIQTLGRIKRNPYPNLAKHPITDTYYLYENFKTPKDYTTYSYQVKEPFKGFQVLKIVLNIEEKAQDPAAIQKGLDHFITQNAQRVQDYANDCFNNEDAPNTYRLHHAKRTLANLYSLLHRLKRLKNALNTPQKGILNEILNKLKAKYPHTSPLQFEAILLEFFSQDIANIYSTSLARHKTYMPHLETYTPQEWREEWAQEPTSEEIDPDKYLTTIKKDANPTEHLPLDSASEIEVCKKLDRFACKNQAHIEVWLKNPPHSNVYIQYLDQQGNKHASYPDFVMRFSNGYLVYIEVKNAQDINQEKTKLLAQAYKEYFSNPKQENLYTHTSPLVLCIYKHDPKKPVLERYYDLKDPHLKALEESGTDLSHLLTTIKNAPKVAQ